MRTFRIGRYELDGERFYDRERHLWVMPGDDTARLGFDPLGSETSGDIVAVSFDPVGTEVERGQVFGSLEAAKFVGPLTSPVAGRITAHNAAVVANPSLLNQAPLDHWLIEVALGREEELAGLLRGEGQVRPWFEAEVARFEERGMIAE